MLSHEVNHLCSQESQLSIVMTTDSDHPDSRFSTRLTSEPLGAVQHLRVSTNSPETSTNNALDLQRCSALHNAIVRHTWWAQGYDVADLPFTAWWQRKDYVSKLAVPQEHLPGSLVGLPRACTKSGYGRAPGQVDILLLILA
jgi:hypothetical protein